MNAMVQQVTENMETGETTISVGIQSHLGQMDFAALVAMTRRRPIVQDAFAATRAPGPENTNCYGGKEPKAQQMLNNMATNGAASAITINGTANGNNFLGIALHTIDLAVCQNGTASTIEVYGPP
jgi:hypothetical protein